MVATEKVIQSTIAYEGRRLKLRVDKVELASGRVTTREVVEHPDSVAIVAIDNDRNVITVRQYRSAAKAFLLEIPAGKIEHGEHPVQSVHRELLEETGYRANRIEPLGGFFCGPGYVTEYLLLYLATELEPADYIPDTDEIAEVVKLSLSDVKVMIEAGEICDAKSIAGLLRVISELHV